MGGRSHGGTCARRADRLGQSSSYDGRSDRQTDRQITSDRQTDGQTDRDSDQTDRQTEPPAPRPPPPPREWALRRTPGPRPRGLGGPAQGNREYVGGGTCRYCA